MVVIKIKTSEKDIGEIEFEIPNDLLIGNVTEEELEEVSKIGKKLFKDEEEIVRLIRESRGGI